MLIKGQCFYEEEIEPPDYPKMSFEDNVELREMYIKRKVQALELKYQHYLEDKIYEIVLIAESKMNQEVETKKVEIF